MNRLSGGVAYLRSIRAQNIRERVGKHPYYTKITRYLSNRPMTSFFVVLGILFLVIVLGSILNKPETEKTAEQDRTKNAQIFTLGESPKVTLQAKVEKSGVVSIMAQTAGVVSKIHVSVGDGVQKGTQIISLSSNYQGGNAPAIQTTIAHAQYENTKKTYDTQKELISKQREVAEKSEKNTNELRDISEQSVGQTESLLNINRDILATITENLQMLENNNPNGVNDATILQTRQIRAQVESGVVQLEGGLRNLRYSTSDTSPAADLVRLQKDITLKQLDIQEKALDLQKKVSGLQVSLAAIGESLMYPASPFAGTVERITVREGQLVNPGTLLAVITAPDNTINLIAQVPQHISQSASKMTPSTVLIQNNPISLLPLYISSEATDGQMYTITYALPSEYSPTVTNNQFVSIDIPLSTSDGDTASTPYIPIDAVFQTQDEAYVNVVEANVAISRKLTLGNVYGEYVEVVSGLKSGDKVILDRNILAGDKIQVQ